MDDLQTAYHRSVRWSLLGSAGSAIFQFLQIVVFARLAGPATAGDYALAATFMAFLTPLAEAGLSQAIVQSRETRPELLTALAWINFAAGLLFFGLICWLGPLVATWYGRPALSHMLLLMGFSLLITPLGAARSALLVREMRFDTTAKIEVISWAGSFLTLLLLAWQGQGIWAMAAGFLVRNVLATLGCWWATRGEFTYRFSANSWKDVLPYLRFGLFDLAARWTDFLANYLDKLIVGKWLGATALGYYNLAFTLLMLPTARLGYVVTRITFPLFAKVRDDAERLQFFFQQSAIELILVLFPVYMGLILFSREIVQLIFGETWLPAAPLLVAFGFAGLVRSLAAPFPQLLKGLGKPQLLFVWMGILTLAFNGMLILFLFTYPSAVSAAWSRVVAKFLLETLMLLWLAKRCGVRLYAPWSVAAQIGFYFLPIAILTRVVGIVSANFWFVLSLKSLVFLAGGWWIVVKSPLRNHFKSLLSNFIKAKKS